MKKYRYVMSGMFTPTDGEEYEINIPSPFLHNTKGEAMKDNKFGYRFVLLDETVGPEIIVYENENFKVIEDENGKHLKTWVEGNVLKTYSFEDFKKAGGYIRMLKPECKGQGFIDGNTDFLDTDKTFEDIFPDMKKQKLYYIDNEAYFIQEVEVENNKANKEFFMNKTICLKTDGAFLIVVHACPDAEGEFQWYLLDEPNSEKKEFLTEEVYESIVLPSDVIGNTYKNKWLACKCKVDGEEYNEGCIFLSNDFIEMISTNQFDEIKFFDEKGNFRDDIGYCKATN